MLSSFWCYAASPRTSPTGRVLPTGGVVGVGVDQEHHPVRVFWRAYGIARPHVKIDVLIVAGDLGRELGFVVDRGPQDREPAPAIAPRKTHNSPAPGI